MTTDEILDYAEPSIKAKRLLAKAEEAAAFNRFAMARVFVAEAAEHLVAMETALNALEARASVQSRASLLHEESPR